MSAIGDRDDDIAIDSHTEEDVAPSSGGFGFVKTKKLTSEESASHAVVNALKARLDEYIKEVNTLRKKENEYNELKVDYARLDEMATILKPNIKNARLTFSACNLGNKDFMMKLFRTKGELHSVLAPCEETFFDKASIFWNSFYTLLFRSAREASKSNNKVSISNDMIEEIVLQLCIAFKETVALGHFCPGGKTRDDDPKFCYKICNPNPWRNFYSERRA